MGSKRTRRITQGKTPETKSRSRVIDGPRGGKIRTGGNPGNSGGKKGRSGRPPMRFKSFLAEMRQDPLVHAELQETLRDRESRHYPAALKVLTDYDDELPANMTPEERVARLQEFMRLAERRRAEGQKPAT
jgi:hypothetical protein